MKGTIKSKRDMERLFRQGRRSSSYLMSVLVLPAFDGDGQGRCAYIAGKKLGSAPLRNRCKRVLRECSREIGAPWEGFDIAFIARGKLARADHADIVADMKRLLVKQKVLERG